MDIDRKEEKHERRLGCHEGPYAVNLAEFATHHRVWNRVHFESGLK